MPKLFSMKMTGELDGVRIGSIRVIMTAAVGRALLRSPSRVATVEGSSNTASYTNAAWLITVLLAIPCGGEAMEGRRSARLVGGYELTEEQMERARALAKSSSATLGQPTGLGDELAGVVNEAEPSEIRPRARPTRSTTLQPASTPKTTQELTLVAAQAFTERARLRPKVSRAYLREAPSLDAKIVGLVNQDEEVLADLLIEDWYVLMRGSQPLFLMREEVSRASQ